MSLIQRFKRKNKGEVKAASPQEIRAGLQEYLDYWDRRILLGDPLFDQWMVDAYEATKKGLEAMDALEEAGIPTGKDEIKSKLERTPSSVVLSIKKKLGGYYSYNLAITLNGGTAHLSGEGKSEGEILEKMEARVAKDYPEATLIYEGLVDQSI